MGGDGGNVNYNRYRNSTCVLQTQFSNIYIFFPHNNTGKEDAKQMKLGKAQAVNAKYYVSDCLCY